jgi:hypothetical protein
VCVCVCFLMICTVRFACMRACVCVCFDDMQRNICLYECLYVCVCVLGHEQSQICLYECLCVCVCLCVRLMICKDRLLVDHGHVFYPHVADLLLQTLLCMHTFTYMCMHAFIHAKCIFIHTNLTTTVKFDTHTYVDPFLVTYAYRHIRTFVNRMI